MPKTKTSADRKRFARKCKQQRRVAPVILPCAVKDLLKGRPDQKLLTDHLKAIEVHRRKYLLRIKKETDAAAIPAHKAKVTEAKGEHEATLFMIENYPDAVILWTFTAGTGIDQLWFDPPDEYVIVEAKGPGATLSTGAAKGDQMSKQWVRNSLEEVVNSPNTAPADRNHAQRMLDAMDVGPPPKVHGCVIEARKDGGSEEKLNVPDSGIYHKTT